MPFTCTWDLFCRVIDNHGDLGVAWRLARQLTQAHQRIRLWVDDASALRWMAPELQQGHSPDGLIQVLPWGNASAPEQLAALPPADIWVELFGCELPDAFVHHRVTQHAQTHASQPVWLNLEYLSGEAYVARSHRLPSHIFSGPASGWRKWFFYPGFTPDTGGLLLSHVSTPSAVAANPARVRTTLFCYEPPGLQSWLQHMGCSEQALPLSWRVMPGRPATTLATALAALGGWPAGMQGTELAHMSQTEFDAELALADLNFVRGEDSLVSALRAGKPFVWHIYPQDDDAHHDKLQAFLDWLQAPPSLVAMHRAWNGIGTEPAPVLTTSVLAEWQDCARAAQSRLAGMPNLTQQLLDFVAPLLQR